MTEVTYTPSFDLSVKHIMNKLLKLQNQLNTSTFFLIEIYIFAFSISFFLEWKINLKNLRELREGNKEVNIRYKCTKDAYTCTRTFQI